MELAVRFERTTWGLQNPCSANWATLACLQLKNVFNHARELAQDVRGDHAELALLPRRGVAGQAVDIYGGYGGAVRVDALADEARYYTR